MKSIYLDYAAATPLDSEVLAAMQPYFTDNFYNPSAIYLAARAVKKDLNEARSKIAMWLGARPAEIYFTAGATEANNLAIQGIMREFPAGQVLASAIEHDSVLAPVQQFRHKLIPVTRQGVVDVAKLKKLIAPSTILISVMLVNNELGTTQPIKEISALIKEARASRLAVGNNTPLYLHVDAAQAGNLFDLHAHRLGVDLMSINGGKIYGPKQSGALYIRAGVQLKPIIVGGGQEQNIRSGTENVPGAIGLSKALDLAQKKHAKEFKKLNELRQDFINELLKLVPQAVVNGSNRHQSPHIANITFPSHDNERLMMQLDELGVICGLGSACSASSTAPSHVLAAIGLSEAEARSTLRFSFGRNTTKSDLQKTARILAGLLAV